MAKDWLIQYHTKPWDTKLHVGSQRTQPRSLLVDFCGFFLFVIKKRLFVIGCPFRCVVKQMSI